ncbi:hypothetical protein [Streptomyces wuyuanensis]|uniref:DUF1349 domain-containing protein n=1 Tax=Streptomyces wuyuanensis TaxID=1196353 RepID=A0A1G9ZB60_9ACTN|nr:hypothetical protein [Streptomyces wuyuanensis]SDN17856.1 hypothetical protein SAMN05444921_12126 [Streptomyces wuyuanensis]
MPGFGMLQDGFDDGVVDPVLWSQSYGDPVESGGRARIPCTSGFAGYRSASVYSLSWSQVALRAYPPAANGASTAALSLLVLSDVGGQDAGFIVDRAQNAMGLYLRQGYADGAALFPAYDPVAHAWLRLREDAGSLFWESSPDGAAWTVLRTAASPAWTAQSNLSFLMESHRDAGTSNFAEADSLNIARPGGLTVSSRDAAGPRPYARTGSTLIGG